MAKNKMSHVWIVIFLVVIGAILTISMGIIPNAFTSVVLFFLVPFLLLVRKGHVLFRPIFFSLIVAIPAIVMIDTIAHMTEQWLIPNSILTFRLFHFVTLEVVLWAVLNFSLFLFIWENYFLLSKKSKTSFFDLNKIIAYIFIIVLFLLFLIFRQYLQEWKYFYASYGTILIGIPAFIFFFRKPDLQKNFLILTAMNILLTGTYEAVALVVGWWSFPGEYILAFDPFGHVLPLEEIIFWIVLFPIAILSYYDFFFQQELGK